MTEHALQSSSAALAALDESWAYYTPEPVPEPAGEDYLDLPVEDLVQTA